MAGSLGDAKDKFGGLGDKKARFEELKNMESSGELDDKGKLELQRLREHFNKH